MCRRQARNPFILKGQSGKYVPLFNCESPPPRYADYFFPIYEHLFEYIGTQFPPPSSLMQTISRVEHF